MKEMANGKVIMNKPFSLSFYGRAKRKNLVFEFL